MQDDGLDRPEHRPKDWPTAAEVAGQLPLGAASDLAVWWTDFNGELQAPDDAKKAGEDRRTSTTFPPIQPHHRHGKWWLGMPHPPPPPCVIEVRWRPATRAADDPMKQLGSVEGMWRRCGSVHGLRKEMPVSFPPPPAPRRRCHASSADSTAEGA